jgi:hypothetical protein
MSYYHYTNGSRLGSILKDGIIKTSKILLDKKEKPATWLTKSPEWDLACNVGIVKNTKELAVEQDYLSDEVRIETADYDYMKKEIGMCRILINESLPVISWAKFRYVSGVEWTSYYVIDECSRTSGSPVDKWICTFSEIPKKYWEGIEMFVDDQWVKWDKKISIEKFIDICLSCNGNQEIHNLISDENIKDNEVWNHKISKEHCQKQIDFMNAYRDEIAEFWEANKHKKGFIAVHVTDDYKLYDCGLIFKERRVKKSTFYPILWKSRTENIALVHFFWEATFTQYRMAFAYGKITEIKYS